MNGEETYDVRVLPLVKKVIDEDSGKTNIVENLSRIEIKEMSCEPRMLEKRDDDVYFTELPINYHGSKVRWSLFYLYDELNDLEKEKFSSRTIYIPVTVDSVVRLYTNKVRKKEK